MVFNRKQIVDYLQVVIVLLCFLAFRNFLVPLYPFVVLLLFIVLKLKISQSDLFFVLTMTLVAIASSLLEGLYFPKFFFSLYLILPSFLLVVSRTSYLSSLKGSSLFNGFFKKSSILLILVNISAFIYYYFIVDTSVHNYEDSFTGLFGRAGFGSHTLSLINLVFSVFFLYTKRIWHFIFFLVCGVMGFYGLGLVMFAVTFLFLYASEIFKQWKALLAVFATFLVIGLVINTFNARNLKYIEKNIEKAMLVFDSYDYNDEMTKSKRLEVTEIPRFITFLDGTQKRFFRDFKVLALGTGPGGYNSRTAFYFNGDFVQNEWFKNNFADRSKYHEEDILPLLNRELTKRRFNDGTRNQTFSSIIAILLEYGVFIGGYFLFRFFFKLKSIKNRVSSVKHKKSLDFLFLFTIVIMAFQNYLEYPELILPIILFFKFSEIDIVNNENFTKE